MKTNYVLLSLIMVQHLNITVNLILVTITYLENILLPRINLHLLF